MQKNYCDLLPLLTVQEAKAQAYRSDFVSDQAWEGLCQVWGDQVCDFVYDYSFVLIKPEAIARRSSRTVLLFLMEMGLVPVAVAQARVDRNAAHLIWRFQWNAATVDRVRLTNMVNAQSASILILVRDAAPCSVPTSVKLWGMKGSAHADRRSKQHLRTLLHMHNRMLGFVHTPDEPADLVRDLSILLDGPTLHALMHECVTAVSRPTADLAASAYAQVQRIEAASLQNEVDPDRSLDRLELALGGQTDELSAVKNALANRTKMPLNVILGAIDAKNTQTWDVLTIACELIQHDRSGVNPLIDARAVSEVTSQWIEHGDVLKNTLKESINACK